MVEIRLTNYNNKSRKGTYIYIKEPKKPGRAYKYTGLLVKSNVVDLEMLFAENLD